MNLEELQAFIAKTYMGEKEQALRHRLMEILVNEKTMLHDWTQDGNRYVTPGAGEFWAFRGRIIMHSALFFTKDCQCVFRIDFIDEPDTEADRARLITAYTPKPQYPTL